MKVYKFTNNQYALDVERGDSDSVLDAVHLSSSLSLAKEKCETFSGNDPADACLVWTEMMFSRIPTWTSNYDTDGFGWRIEEVEI